MLDTLDMLTGLEVEQSEDIIYNEIENKGLVTSIIPLLFACQI